MKYPIVIILVGLTGVQEKDSTRQEIRLDI